MPFAPFYQFYPELAQRETRCVTLLEPDFGLPAGQYGMMEMYCDEPGCDCRRVFFTVISRQYRDPLAIVAYGWESLEFYARWAKFGGPKMAKELQGPILNFGSPQSRLAPAVLTMIKELLLQDPAYIERLKRHYSMVREAVDQKTGPRTVQRPDRRQREQLRARKLQELQARRSLKRKPRP